MLLLALLEKTKSILDKIPEISGHASKLIEDEKFKKVLE